MLKGITNTEHGSVQSLGVLFGCSESGVSRASSRFQSLSQRLNRTQKKLPKFKSKLLLCHRTMRGCSPHFHETFDLTESIDTSLIDPPKNSLRDPAQGIVELVSSIREKGLIQPIIVRPKAERFEVVAGARRLEACKRVRWERVPCIIRELSDKDAYELSLVENLQRQTMSALEEADAFHQYLGARKWGTELELAEKIGKSQQYVSQRLALLSLPPSVREKITRRLVSPSIAAEIARLGDTRIQEELAHAVLEKSMTVEKVRKTAKLVKKGLSVEDAVIEAEIETHLVNSDELKRGSSEPDFVGTKSTLGNGLHSSEECSKEVVKAHMIVKLAMLRLGLLIDQLPEGCQAKEIILEKRFAIHTVLDSLIRARMELEAPSDASRKANGQSITL